jgi:uncharacterized membrane protein YagU involved in acid resistance
MQRLAQKPFLDALVKEALRSGAIAALVMAPFGLLFYLLGLRVNEYGLKVIRTFFGDLPLGLRFGLFALEHFVISWSASLPLLLLLLVAHRRVPVWLVGALYGTGFYLLVNSLALPWLFGDPTPWELGWNVIYPSLSVHIVYGVSVALASRVRLLEKRGIKP